MSRAFRFSGHAVRRFSRTLIIGISALGVVAGACAGDEDQPPRYATAKSAPRPDAPHPAAQHAAKRDTFVSAGEVVRDSEPAIEKGIWLNDANLLALLRAMSVRQKVAADIELRAWHSDTVRAVAAATWRDHTALMYSIDSVATAIKLAPVMPALADVIIPPLQAQVDSLYGMGGPSLDRAFIRQQVNGQESMARVAAQLATVAERPEVQALLQSAAGRVGAQASRAKALHGQMAAADSVAAAARADSAAKREARRKRQAKRDSA